VGSRVAGTEARVQSFLDRVVRVVTDGFRAARGRSARFDHVVRAYERYDEVAGGRLAAANAYYGFFAVFAMAVLLLGILGYVLQDNALVVGAVQRYLQQNLPQVKIATLIGTTQSIGQLAVIGLALAGIGWVETLRSSQRAIWGFNQQPGNFVVRWLVDMAVLVSLGVLLTVSVSIAAGVQDLMLQLAGEPRQSALRIILNQSATLLAGVVDLVLAAALLAGVARIRMPLRRLFPSALIIAVGLLGLKTLGRLYISRTQHNPAYQVFASAVGLLVFMYLFSQLVLYAAAFAATSRNGAVRDLAAGSPPAIAAEPEPVGPDGAGPESAGADGGGPESAGPDGAGPESAGPDGAGRPIAAEPESAGPEAAGPETTGPDGTGRPIAGPEAAESAGSVVDDAIPAHRGAPST
jgi:membrane protein